MTDPLEDQLRAHFAEKAAHIQVDADPGALMERSVGRSGRGPLAIGAVAVAVVLTGAGVLTGAALAGGKSTTSQLAAAPSTTGSGRAGVMAGPNPGAESTGPAVAVPTPYYTPLFTRTSASGVTIRTYQSGSGRTGGCPQNAACLEPGRLPEPTPCPAGAMCAQPQASPPVQHVTTGGGQHVTTGGGESVGSGGGSPGSDPGNTVTPAAAPTGVATTVPPLPVAGCGQLLVEMSTAKAVGTASLPGPGTATPTPDSVEILGQGSFGTVEGAPVGWVAAWVGDGVTSVGLSSGGGTVDSMAPSSGIVVLAVPGDADLSGSMVVGVGQDGGVVSSVPADQAPVGEPVDGCTTGPTSTTTTTATTPPSPTVPVIIPPTTTTTSSSSSSSTTTPTTTPTTAPPTPSPTGAPVAAHSLPAGTSSPVNVPAA